jgi:hypothetical protein
MSVRTKFPKLWHNRAGTRDSTLTCAGKNAQYGLGNTFDTVLQMIEFLRVLNPGAAAMTVAMTHLHKG